MTAGKIRVRRATEGWWVACGPGWARIAKTWPEVMVDAAEESNARHVTSDWPTPPEPSALPTALYVCPVPAQDHPGPRRWPTILGVVAVLVTLAAMLFALWTVNNARTNEGCQILGGHYQPSGLFTGACVAADGHMIEKVRG